MLPLLLSISCIGCMHQPAYRSTEVLKALYDSREAVRRDTMSALLRKRDAANVPILIDLVKNHVDPWICHDALLGLAQLGPKSAPAIPTLVHLLKHPEDDKSAAVGGRSAVQAALAAIGKGALPEMVAILKERKAATSVRFAAIEVVRAMTYSDPPYIERVKDLRAAVPGLLVVLDDKDDELRQRAFFALQDIGPEARHAVPTLVRFVKGGDVVDRICAAAALASIHPNNDFSAPVLIDIASGDPQAKNRAFAISVLDQTRIQSPPVVRTFIASLADQDKGVQVYAVYGLSHLDRIPHEAIPLIERLRASTDPRVRYAAKVALEKASP